MPGDEETTTDDVFPYETLEYLAGGSQGCVYLGRRRRRHSKMSKTMRMDVDGEEEEEEKEEELVALKYFRSSGLDARGRENLRREIECMTRMREKMQPQRCKDDGSEEHVVRLFDVLTTGCVVPASKEGPEEDGVCLAMEYCEGGELLDYLIYSGRFDERLARTYFRQLVRAVRFLHETCGFAHRDVKPENVLLKRGALKLADYGFATKCVYDDDSKTVKLLRTACGTRGYMAPELLGFQPYEGEPVDVWSAGVLLFVMLVGAPPMAMAQAKDWWFDRLASRQYDLFWRAHEQTGVVLSPAAKDLIVRMLHPDPTQRLGLKEIANHPWVKNGSVLTSDDAIRLLSERKQIALKRKRLEKETEEARRRAKDRDAEFDPFAASTVYRGRPSSSPDAKRTPREEHLSSLHVPMRHVELRNEDDMKTCVGVFDRVRDGKVYRFGILLPPPKELLEITA